MTDLQHTAIGPQGPNFTVVRPSADPTVSAGLDTWCKNCSEQGATDGTYLTADFFNVIIDQLRTAIRNSGITLDNSNSSMLYQAIQSVAKTTINTFLTNGAVIASRGLKTSVTQNASGNTVVNVQSTLGDGSRTLLV